MSRLVTYVAVLDDLENEKNVFTVTFPDVRGAITDGNGLAKALKNAEEVLGLMLFDSDQLPAPTDLEIIRKNNPSKIVNYVVADLDEAQEESYVPLVKKNTTIPVDIAKRAERAGINFSETLTNALKEKLG